jgi:AcrR family transcriptional regulator
MTDNNARRKANRQARGLQRVETILVTAANVFSEVGYADATMNMIASRANLSPGSLYQFFPNKGAVAEALAIHYIEQISVLYDQFLSLNPSMMPLPMLIDRFLDPLVAFNRENPAFYTLFIGAQVSPELAAILSSFHEKVIQYIAVIIGQNIPTTTEPERHRSALLLHRIFLAIIPLIVATDASESALILGNMKLIFVTYLSALSTS